jgi:hypothetical protein
MEFDLFNSNWVIFAKQKSFLMALSKLYKDWLEYESFPVGEDAFQGKNSQKNRLFTKRINAMFEGTSDK